MIACYFNDNNEVLLEQRDIFIEGKWKYKSPINLPCYVNESKQLVRTDSNETVSSNASYFTNIEISVNDKINGELVISVSKVRTLDEVYWRAYV